MSTPNLPDVRPGRLSSSECASRFAQAATPPLTPSQALLEAERCLYCFDAPCASACPTSIDIPSFIRRIADGNERGAARQILEVNPLGGLCARVCPTEDLCEKVCVRNTQTGVPVAIGRLQRHATDALMASSRPQVFTRAAPTGKRVAVLGAGPAGLACAHTLARHGHDVTVFDAHPKPGGLNEYGLATYKVADNFAQREVQWLLDIGGITLQPNWVLNTADQLNALRQDFDAVFLGMGLADTHRLGVPGEDLGGVQDAVDFIATLREAADKATVPVGRRVVVIGGGMTAVDAAVQSKLLGAESVTLVYRRGPASMAASKDEQDWALKHGVVIQHWLAPAELQGNTEGHVSAVRFARHALANGKLAPTGDTVKLPADTVLKAIGQTLGNAWLADTGLALTDGRIAADDSGQTNLPGVWVGGDCRAGGLDLTVEAVAHGHRAALAMHQALSA
ncbi:MAG: NAD(P)-dependent oxidoreductase [Burkholderiaceae bacterium]|nr:NAD(P)-dependent oxidoreductase [Burkholderiaceae bacterium]